MREVTPTLDEFSAILLVADFATVSDGKLTVVGAGWSYVGPEPSPMAIGVIIYVPWSETNRKHSWKLTLFTGDGHPATVATPEGDMPVEIEGNLEAGRALGSKPGRPISVPIGINLGPLQLTPGQDFTWQLSIGAMAPAAWRVHFSVRSVPPG